MNLNRANALLVMLYNEWKILTNDNRPLDIEWNMMHMFSSSQVAKLYALKKGLDIELCAMIAILHDIAVVEGRIRKDHDKLAKIYVMKAIARLNKKYEGKISPISQEEMNIIVNAITCHSNKSGVSDNEYAEMLKDVDSLEHLLYGLETEGAYLERSVNVLDMFNIKIEDN